MNPVFEAFDAVLRDGRTVHIRMAGPADEAGYLRAFDRLSPDARYLRFMRVVREPNRAALRRVLASFPDHGCAIVATVPSQADSEIVGSALCIIGQDSGSCEFAMTVAADHANAGLGGILLSSIIDAAKRRGLDEMTGYILAANAPMLRLAKRIGFSIALDPDDATTRIARMRLRASPAPDR